MINHEVSTLTEKFFRRQYAHLVARLTRILGTGRMQVAEDMVQDTLVEAMRQWEFNGIPDNPEAWLYTVARNKTLNYLKIEGNRKNLLQDHKVEENFDLLAFDDYAFKDQQLNMMFVCCHPAINVKAQITLILKTLCGLSIKEITESFLSSEDTINKRLVRARKKLREVSIKFELPPADELQSRLDTVLKAMLLLFNEGYSTSHGNLLIREELCNEAIRLTELMTSNDRFADTSDIHSLLALMYFQISRFSTRVDDDGVLVSLEHQNRGHWDHEMIQKGLNHLAKMEESQTLSFYKISATIAAHHSTAASFSSTNWSAILDLYSLLTQIDSSPLIEINRSVALAQVHGYSKGLQLLESLNLELIGDYQHYYTTKAEFQKKLNRKSEAKNNYSKALKIVQSTAERKYLQNKLSEL